MPYTITRRHLISTALGAPALVIATRAGFAQMSETAAGANIHPVQHASLWLEWAGQTIIVDPVGGAELYSEAGTPDIVLVTHIHGDHFDLPTLEGIVGDNTMLVAPPTVHAELSEALAAKTTVMENGDTGEMSGFSIAAIPAYNTTEDRMQYHPKGRDNGYVLDDGTNKIYIAGDTEPTPEMAELTGIDVAFLPMNLPYTMTEEQAAEAVASFGPAIVYPYHYRDSDPQLFADLVADKAPDTEVRLYDWYG